MANGPDQTDAVLIGICEFLKTQQKMIFEVMVDSQAAIESLKDGSPEFREKFEMQRRIATAVLNSQFAQYIGLLDAVIERLRDT